jgi:hypothetical protein
MICRTSYGYYKVVEITQFEWKMRKLCINEIWGIKMKKNEKKHILKFEKSYFV